MHQPIILCGLGRVGWRVLEYLRAAGLPVVVIDTACTAADPRLAGVHVVSGDCRRREVLAEAGVASAGGVLILTSDDLVNISTALMVRHLHPDVRVVLRMFNQNLITRLGKAVNNVFALSTSTLAAPVLAVTALTGQALGTFRVEGVAGAAAAANGRPGEAALRRQVSEMTIGPGHNLRGQPVAAVTAGHDIVVVAHFPANGPARFLTDVDGAARLEAGDRLVVCGDPRGLAPLLAQGDEDEGPVLWGSWLRRLGRMAWRTAGEIDLPVKVCTAVLVLVLVASTVVLHITLPSENWGHALYRTVNLIASRSDMDVDAAQSGWLHLFVSLLRISGVVLTAAFTAIVTNYLLRARLGGALEVRRIPDRGHVIVCGLGNIGFRLVEELLGYGERVVVIEVKSDGRFVTTARRLGAAVIHGDATVREVLRQANAATARAVLAATSDDLVNLEVALLVREQNERQRVVLRLSDPHLAQTLREAANVRFALSIAALAAPAFVAALYGDRVLGVFLVGERLLAVVDVLIQPQDTHLIGQTARAVAVDYQLLPVAALAPGGAAAPDPAAARLAAGSRLIGFISLADLERLVRRQPVPCDCAVDVTGFHLPTRDWVALLLRTQQGLTPEAADAALEHLPVRLGNNLTRGQAEDLLALLQRERVAAELRRVESAARTPG